MSYAKTYAAWAEDKSIRLASSSGGVFYLIGKMIIIEGGVVVGAAFDEKHNVFLDIVDNLEGLKRLCGSKYVQATVGDVYQRIEKMLISDRKVLFSGTPCQCNALTSFLKKKYEKLILVDIICHGVPVKGVWEKYVRYVTANDEIHSVNFRDKRHGWNNYGVTVMFTNGLERYEELGKNPFMQLFLCNITLRRACYYCKSKGKKRTSDITLGDFWGYNHYESDELGCSAIIVNTKKGESLVKTTEGIVSEESSMKDLLRFNRYYLYTAGEPLARKRFFTDLRQGKNVFITWEDYCTRSFCQRVVGRCLKELKKASFLVGNKKYIASLRRGKIVDNLKELCVGCAACSSICAYGAIKMEQDEEGSEYPVFEKTKCVNCGKCENVCMAHSGACHY